MSKVTKTTALFFAAMIFFISISTENYGLLITSHIQNTGSENSGSYFSKEEPVPLFLSRHEERLVTSVKDLPVTSSKNNPTDFHSNRLLNEVRLLSINTRYLSYSVTVDRNLTNSDLVFPFHYFW
jgi:hypothetical protein